MSSRKDLKVAIVCDWLTAIGGAERVVKKLHEMYPEAPIYTSQYNPEKIDWFKNADVRTGWMDKLPKNMHKFFPVLRSVYFSRLDLSEYDLVISSSGAEAKGVQVRDGATHICYMHAATQYYWSLYDDYIKNPGFGWLNPIARLALKVLVGPMRSTDKKFSSRPHFIIANSNYVKDEIKKYYGRDSTVIFPPVDTKKFSLTPSKKRHGFVVTSRQMSWKRLDIAVEACRNLNKPLTVIGEGSEHSKLVQLASGSENIRFLPTQNDDELRKSLANAEGFIFPSKEPFGIAPVEALASGTPVIAYGEGGALDYIKDKVNGLFFTPQNTKALEDALNKFEQMSFDGATIRQSADRFSNEQFKQQMSNFIEQALEKRGGHDTR